MRKARFFYLFFAAALALALGLWISDFSRHAYEMNAAEHRAYAIWCAFLALAMGVARYIDKRRGTV